MSLFELIPHELIEMIYGFLWHPNDIVNLSLTSHLIRASNTNKIFTRMRLWHPINTTIKSHKYELWIYSDGHTYSEYERGDEASVYHWISTSHFVPDRHDSTFEVTSKKGVIMELIEIPGRTETWGRTMLPPLKHTHQFRIFEQTNKAIRIDHN